MIQMQRLPKQGRSVTHRSFFRNLRIGSKLLIGFNSLILLMLVVSGLSYLGSALATTKIDRTDALRVPTALAASRARVDLLRMLASTRGYLALGDAEFRDAYTRDSDAFKADLIYLEQLSSNFTAEKKQRLDEVSALFATWSPLPSQLFDLRDDQLAREPAYKLLATDGTRLAGSVLIDIQQMIESQALQPASAGNTTLMRDMASFQGSFAAIVSGLRGYVTTRNRIFRGEYETNLSLNQIPWDRLSIARPTLTANQQALLDRVASNRIAFLALPDQIFKLLESDRWREDLFLFKTQAEPLGDKMLSLLDEITEDQQTLLRMDLAEGRNDLSNANQQILMIGFLALVLGTLMAWFLQRNIAGPIRRLTGVAAEIGDGRLDAQARIESGDEIGTLAETFNTMTSYLRQTLAHIRLEKKRADDLLDVVIPIGVALSAERDFNQLLEKIVCEAQAFCHADGGMLYLLTKEQTLRLTIARSDAAQIALGGTTGHEISDPPLPLYREQGGEPNDESPAVRSALTGTTINLSELEAERAGQAGVAGAAAPDGGRPSSLLTIPLKNSRDQVLGVLQLSNATNPETRRPIPFDPNLQEMMESLSSLAAAALESYIRERALRKEIQQLRIEIDDAKGQQQVQEIVETDFFRDLQVKARSMRNRRRESNE